MKSTRRTFAFIAAAAVAFGALWPLVSAAAPRSPEIPSFICTQGGFQHSDAPVKLDDAFHCPLCVVGADSVIAMDMPAHSWSAAGHAPRAASFESAFRPFLEARPPPSRAPPHFS